MLNLAQVAFDAYCKHRSGITYDAKPIPSWDNLTPEIREAWGAAAHAILRAISESFMNGATGQVYISEGTPHYVDVANDLARKTLDLPTDCDALPPTFEERHAANDEALAEIRAFVYGEAK